MTMKAVMQAYQRRAVLTLLAYDADYTLSENMLSDAMSYTGHNISMDEQRTILAWLEEQGYITQTNQSGFVSITLTDRGLEVAMGKSRAPGIRDLRPSEIHEIGNR